MEKVELEESFEMSQEAREETEHFLNCWIDDHSKGWPIRASGGGKQLITASVLLERTG
jgi:hypothetical protein